jgi:hypothetical protein
MDKKRLSMYILQFFPVYTPYCNVLFVRKKEETQYNKTFIGGHTSGKIYKIYIRKNISNQLGYWFTYSLIEYYLFNRKLYIIVYIMYLYVYIYRVKKKFSTAVCPLGPITNVYFKPNIHS